ncbi:unnamed protein product [Amoebophrya sp. A25]|nr:unnamed protein product [Amoebophrya sp. A25]|eukprot:GSA25T00008414001.1
MSGNGTGGSPPRDAPMQNNYVIMDGSPGQEEQITASQSIAMMEELRLASAEGVAGPGRNISAMQVGTPPFSTVLIYNQSRHASNSVLSDIRSVWGDAVTVVQTVEDSSTEPTSTATNSVANNRLPGVNDVIMIRPGKWGDLNHFQERMEHYETQNPWFYQAKKKKDVAFMAGWSALAEAADTGRFVMNKLKLVWPGTEPNASDRLEKIGMKKICKKVGAPTPPFTILADQDFEANLADPGTLEKLIHEFTDKVVKLAQERTDVPTSPGGSMMNTTSVSPIPGLVKSIHGGGGKGSAQVSNPLNATQVKAAVRQVLNEMKRADGLYFEEKVNHDGDGRFFQLELELDGVNVSNGGRFVWFNKRLQKVVEIGLTDRYLKDLSDAHHAGRGEDLPCFIPWDLYSQSRTWAAQIATEAGNNTRCTLEALVWQDKSGKYDMAFIECNRRPQVENEALALLERDSSNHRRYTFAELLMRAKGYPSGNIFTPTGRRNVACHARWLHGDPDADGAITYKPGEVCGMTGTQFAFVRSELMPCGEISFTADPQLGKVVMLAENWHSMCDNAEKYFSMRKPLVIGEGSKYAECMRRLFANKEFQSGRIASNETFSAIEIPNDSRISCASSVRAMLEGPVSDILVAGYRTGEGIDPERYPSSTVLRAVENLSQKLARECAPAENTAFTKYTRGECSFDDYLTELRAQLDRQGGGWVTVAPRDTCQQGNDSESACIQSLSRKNAEIFGQKAGCVGYEVGGAQFQAGLIRGLDPAKILKQGLPFNIPAFSLQRSQYVNGLSEMPPQNRQALFQATATMVFEHYRGPIDEEELYSGAVLDSAKSGPQSGENFTIVNSKTRPGRSASQRFMPNPMQRGPDGTLSFSLTRQRSYEEAPSSLARDKILLEGRFPPVPIEQRPVPFFPYNFHAGNYWDSKFPQELSPQDQTTVEMLHAGLTPIPTWVFSPKFPLERLAEWTKRQIQNFDAVKRKLHQIRIKNPGQGEEWTAATVWKHVETFLKVFAETKHLPNNEKPIVYIHNHDFNGEGGHVGKELLRLAQKNGFRYLVIDAGYRKNGTHNDNTVVCSALELDEGQKAALLEYNNNQQMLEKILCRFDSRDSQMTPWDSEWAGGTEGSDLRIAKEYGLSPSDIEQAKHIASEVFPLERAVTPFSEYKLRLGIAIMIEPAISPKNAQAVISFLKHDHGRLKVGGDVLVGLHKWETLVPKPPAVDMLLHNMAAELDSALSSAGSVFRPNFDATGAEQLYTELGFQQKGKDLHAGKATDLSPLLLCPWVLHARPRALPSMTRIELLLDQGRVAQVLFRGFGHRQNHGEILLVFSACGERIVVSKPDPEAQLMMGADDSQRMAGDNEFGIPVPGEILSIDVAVGQTLEAGMQFFTVESMKMETKITVPQDLHGKVVDSVIAKIKTVMKRGQPVISYK